MSAALKRRVKDLEQQEHNRAIIYRTRSVDRDGCIIGTTDEEIAELEAAGYDVQLIEVVFDDGTSSCSADDEGVRLEWPDGV